jgi:NAD(P)-dependent dehydrogenase (short-subunit alcohol dehydrogenase family)
MSIDMSKAVCVITGSNSGFGKEVAKCIARQGGAVTITGRTAGKNEAVKAECEALGGRAIAVVTEVSDYESVKNLFAKAKEAFGDITHVFINAAVLPKCENYVLDNDEVAVGDIENTLNIDVKGVMYTARNAFKTLVEQGHGGCVVFTSSVMGSCGNGWAENFPAGAAYSLYSGSKSFIDSVARSSTTFAKDHNIRTFTISPSLYITGMTEGLECDYYATMFNPVLKDCTGDARDVARVVMAMFDGTTSWTSGSNVGCEGPFTYDIHERYKTVYAPESFGVCSPPIPLDALCNYLGEPAGVTQASLDKISSDYKASKSAEESIAQ